MATQFPGWADLPIRYVDSWGTENGLYRLGDDLMARLPLRARRADQIDKDRRWLPVFAPRLPLAVPEQVAAGEPASDYPARWSVYRWIEGSEVTLESLRDPVEAARDLGSFVKALRSIDASEGPPPGDHNFGRGVALRLRDSSMRRAIAASRDLVDTVPVTAAWGRALDAPEWTASGVWIHGDLTPGNLLSVNGRLSAVIDWGGLGVGDPATDLLPAWNLFSGESRDAFRDEMDLDDAAWERGKGWALSMAIMALPYYIDTNPGMARLGRAVLNAVLADG